MPPYKLSLLLSLSLLFCLSLFSQTQSLHLGGGLLHSGEQDRAYSPLTYSGSAPLLMVGYSREGSKRSEGWWGHYSAGNRKNIHGARLRLLTAGLFNYTLYHAPEKAGRGFHFGWSNNNLLSLRNFQDARNFSPRFDYHSSLGPAARYRRPLDELLPGLSVEVLGHVQLIGFFLQSSLVSGTPSGYEEGEEGLNAILSSLQLFHPGRAWNVGLWPRLSYTLPSGNRLSLSYRYEYSSLEAARRARSSRGYYFLEVETVLGARTSGPRK